jgi:hypothetical protein
MASSQELAEGLSWYRRAHDEACALFLASPAHGAGLIASLSPQKGWDENLALASRAAETGHASGHWGAQIRKANFILSGGDPRECLHGPKERAFFECIADPNGSHGFICLDRHAINAWHGYLCDDEARKRFASSVRNYRKVSNDYRAVAAELGILPHELQAVIWVVWRNLCGGSRDPYRLPAA